jgi:hypothetical protein
LKLQKQRTPLARRTAAVKSALRPEERKLGAALVRLLKTDAELRVVLLPKRWNDGHNSCIVPAAGSSGVGGNLGPAGCRFAPLALERMRRSSWRVR